MPLDASRATIGYLCRRGKSLSSRHAKYPAGS